MTFTYIYMIMSVKRRGPAHLLLLLSESPGSWGRGQSAWERPSPGLGWGLCWDGPWNTGRKNFYIWSSKQFLHRAQELCETWKSRCRPGLPVPNSPYGLCGRKATLNVNTQHVSELRSSLKVEVAVLGSPSLAVLMVSVDIKQHWTSSYRQNALPRAPAYFQREKRIHCTENTDELPMDLHTLQYM